MRPGEEHCTCPSSTIRSVPVEVIAEPIRSKLYSNTHLSSATLPLVEHEQPPTATLPHQQVRKYCQNISSIPGGRWRWSLLSGSVSEATITVLFVSGDNWNFIYPQRGWAKPPRDYAGEVSAISTWCVVWRYEFSYFSLIFSSGRVGRKRSLPHNPLLHSTMLCDNT